MPSVVQKFRITRPLAVASIDTHHVTTTTLPVGLTVEVAVDEPPSLGLIEMHLDDRSVSAFASEFQDSAELIRW